MEVSILYPFLTKPVSAQSGQGVEGAEEGELERSDIPHIIQ